MRTIPKIKVEVKDDEIIVAPMEKPKHSEEDVSRVRICCRHDEFPESYFYMGKGADAESWIPESSTPPHLTTQILAKIAWRLKELYNSISQSIQPQMRVTA